MRRTAPKGNGTLPMFAPSSDWKPPVLSELPSWQGQKLVGIDTEFADPTLKKLGLGSRRGVKVAGYSFAFQDGYKAYIPVRHPEGNLDCEKAFAYLRDQAKVFSHQLVGANLTVELDLLEYEPTGSIRFQQVEIHRDVLINDALIYEMQADGYSLEAVGQRRVGAGKDVAMLMEAAITYGADIKKRDWKKIIPHLPSKYVGPYGEEDAFLPLQCLAAQQIIIDEQGLQEVVDIESRLIPVLLRMRQRGVRIDFDHLEKVEKWAREEECKALNEIQRLTGIRISPGDTMKLGVCEMAFQAVGIAIPLKWDDKTHKHKKSIDSEFLKTVQHPIGKLLHHARQMSKLDKTFAVSVRAHATNGRLHTTYNQIVGSNDRNEKTGAAFGRLSSKSPNLQQQPARAKYANFWRGIYLPELGTKWGCLDACFSPDTEVLTDRGFVPFPELLPSDLVAQFDTSSRTINFAQPLAYHRPFTDGNLVRITTQNSIDLLVTENHNCLLETKGVFSNFRADQFPTKNGHKQHMAAVWNGANTLTLPERDIVTSVAVQADGTKRTCHYRIWVSRPRKIERAKALVTHTDSYFCEKKGSQTAFLVPLSATPLLLPGPDKVFDRNKLLQLSLEQRLFFLHELLLWDGTGSLGKGKATYATTNKVNAEIVQEIATLTGVKALMSPKPQPGNRKVLHLVYLSLKTVTTTETMLVTKQPYTGHTYCVTMPAGTLVVRRNGKVAITSQSQQEPRWTTHYAALLNLKGARDAAHQYCINPKIDNHDFMAKLTGLERKFAKEIFLGLCYGEGGAKLCRGLGLPTRWCVQYRESGAREYYETKGQAIRARQKYEGEATYYEVAGEAGQAIIDKFNERAPYIKLLAKAAEKRARETGTIRTLGGRAIHFPVKPNGEYDWSYKALNRLIQGTSGYQVKLALIAIDKYMPELFLQLQVHDEVDGSFESIAQMKRAAKLLSEAAGDAYVPFRIDIEYGDNWGNLVQVCGHEMCEGTVNKLFEVNGVKETFWCPEHAIQLAA
jgi:DNA polymerase I-like protein with 3'-5' exonuclease and polymerase domains